MRQIAWIASCLFVIGTLPVAGFAQAADEKRVAYEKSQQFAKEAGVKWLLKVQKDAMTGADTSFAAATFKTQDGALSAEVRLSCVDKSPEVSFFINRFNVPTQYNAQQQITFASGRAKINDGMGEAAYAFNKASTNEFSLNILVDDKLLPKYLGAEDGLFIVYQPFMRSDTKQYVHTLMLELQTRKGPILAKIAALDASVAAVIKSCQ